MSAHHSDLELVIEVLHDSEGNNPKAHYRFFVGGKPVEYDELKGVKNVLAQALISHILAARMAAFQNAGAGDELDAFHMPRRPTRRD